MNEFAIEVQPQVRQRLWSLGDEGVRWLEGLPGLVAELAERWSLAIGDSLPGGTAAYVARVRTSDGQNAVLKVASPIQDDARQTQVLLAARGRGYVRLLAHDTTRRATLQEWLGASLADLVLPPEQMITTLCRTLRTAWTVPPDPVFAPAREKAPFLHDLVHTLWTDLGRPCPERVIDRALDFADRRTASDPERHVVVHGDPHPANLLRAPSRPGAETGFVLIDPDGFLADPAYDLGVVLRDWCDDLLAADAPAALARRYCRLLASSTGQDEQAVWEWGYLERVSSGLYCLKLGYEAEGRAFLTTAELLITA